MLFRSLHPERDVAVSLWTVMNSEWLAAHHLDGIATDRIGSSSFGKMPLNGSPCGDALRTGKAIYVQMPLPPQSLYREFAETMKAGVGSLVAWPLRLRNHAVAVLLVESHEADLLVSNASMNRILNAIASLFELVFQIRETELSHVKEGRLASYRQHQPKD